MKVYFAHLACVQTAAQAAELAAHAAALGFDTIGSNPRLAALSWAGESSENRAESLDAAIQVLVGACQQHQLALMLDLAPDWSQGRREPDNPPDPRLIAARKRPPEADALRSAPADVIVARWSECLSRLAELGVSRFRCLSVAAVPPSTWRRLIAGVRATHPACSFHAWTLGLSWEEINGLAGQGFAGGFTSSAWWDGGSHWLIGESDILERIGPPIAFPAPPAGERLPPALVYASSMPRGGKRRAAFNKALRIAAATANGLLMPMGFEYGATPPASPFEDLPSVRRRASFDLGDEIRAANAIVDQVAASGLSGMRPLNGYAGPVTAFFRTDARDPEHAKEGQAILVNMDLEHTARVDLRSPLPAAAGEAWSIARTNVGDLPALEPGEVRILRARRSPPASSRSTALPSLQAAIDAPRIAIERLSPSVDGGVFAAKRVVGEPIIVEADIFTDGHELMAAELLWRSIDEKDWRRVPMQLEANDRWRAEIAPLRIGRYLVTVEAWWDEFSSLLRDLEKKRAASVDFAVEIAEARLLLRAAAGRAGDTGEHSVLSKLADDLGTPKELGNQKESISIEMLLSSGIRELMGRLDARHHLTRCSGESPIEVERPKAGFASWYEMFPRSATDDPAHHGTFDDVIARLPAIRAMGFDVLYFPPIHPIGETNRKGRNNNPKAQPGDLGSPYAIGDPDGGHDAIHPRLGTPQDFRRLVAAAAEEGIEIALDFAIQCSPDHPWLKEHPGWFKWRPDGSIRYAENPPKKYEDIVNVEFYAKEAPDLWVKLRDIVLHWVNEGVRLFRVDNPHTKPLSFWQWLIADIRTRHKDVIFLSEAFTRPKMMYRLAKVGFSQSYTYFTWRNTKREITEYLTELTKTDVSQHFRPHFFVNTPDINPLFLQASGRPGFLIRAALAATLSGLWGVYSGFELCEAAALPGREEYLDSEKYEIRPRDLSAPGNIVAEITLLNRLRRAFPALQTHLGLTFYNAFNEAILYYGKGHADRGELILVAINLDPHQPQEAVVEIPLWEWGLDDDGALNVEDLVHGHRFVWKGKSQKIRLDPSTLPFAMWRVAPREEV